MSSLAFAQTLSDALGAEIGRDGVPDGGTTLGDPSWLGTRVPAATVEMAYLTNPTEAALLATTSFRQDVAAGVRDGVEAYMPSIIARRDAILAWRQAHHAGAAPGSLAPASAAIPGRAASSSDRSSPGSPVSRSSAPCCSGTTRWRACWCCSSR